MTDEQAAQLSAIYNYLDIANQNVALRDKIEIRALDGDFGNYSSSTYVATEDIPHLIIFTIGGTHSLNPTMTPYKNIEYSSAGITIYKDVPEFTAIYRQNHNHYGIAGVFVYGVYMTD